MADFKAEVYGGNKPIAREGGSFNTKKNFFESEIKEQGKTKTQAKPFRFFSEHELAKMRKEEADKAGRMSKEELLSKVSDASGDEEYNKVLSRMKDLEDDAIRAQAVIAKAQEFQNDESKTSAKAASNQNGEPVEVTKRQIIELNLDDNNSPMNSSNESR